MLFTDSSRCCAWRGDIAEVKLMKIIKFGQRWIRKLSTLRSRAKDSQNNFSRHLWLSSLPTVHLVPEISDFMLRPPLPWARQLCHCTTDTYSYRLFNWQLCHYTTDTYSYKLFKWQLCHYTTDTCSYRLFNRPEKTKRQVGQYLYQSTETCNTRPIRYVLHGRLFGLRMTKVSMYISTNEVLHVSRYTAWLEIGAEIWS